MRDGASGWARRGGGASIGAVVGPVIGAMVLVASCSSDPLDDVTLSGTPVDTAAESTTAERGLAPADGDGTGADPGAPTAVPAGPPSEPSVHVAVDQFGYRPGDPKVAVIADPQAGFDAADALDPGEAIEVRRWSDGEVVLRGRPQPWAGGAVHDQSGDRGWWFDFSSVDAPGSYYVLVPATGMRSGRFDIGDEVYDDVLDAALRMFWFNRANTAHPPELAGPWADGPAYVGPGQDTEARSVDAPDDPGTARDLRGGWFDAGDANKYVTFASEPVHLLLTAYRRHPEVFDDAVGIPESGNGVPDVLDEVRWELDWLARMQLDDGSVLTKVGLTGSEGSSVPSEATAPRFYEEACSSATIAAAAMFAHGSVVFEAVPQLAGEADELRRRAVEAWDWFRANPARDDCDPQVVRAGDADLSAIEQDRLAVVAAVYLLAATGEERYHDAVRAGYADTLPFTGDGFGHYGPDQAEALLVYRDLPGADPAVVAAIDARLAGLAGASPLLGFDDRADLYRAFLPDDSYHWGSNMVKANAGSANLAVDDALGGGVDRARERALGHLHYLHGVNPFGQVYLTSMGGLGAERSAQALFHFWFGEGTAYDVDAGSELGPPPGFLVGGPNRWYSGTAAPPADQPPLKSYRDWSASGSEPSWEITEPAIYYQAAYVRLLAGVLASGAGGS